MTVPTPSSPQHGRSQPSQPYDPWAHHPPEGEGPGGPVDSAPPETPGRGELRDVLLVAFLVSLAGVALGLLWLWLAPRVPYISDGEKAYLRNGESQEAIGVDGTFALLALGVGAVTGLLVFLARRSGGMGMVIGLALGGLLGSVLAWRLGVWLGPGQDLSARAEAAGRGGVFDGPLELAATVALLCWPLAALATHLVATAFFGPRDPAPQPQPYPQWGPPPAP
ncbi:DUF2567 domain-containing protein [Streptomyces gobiensis]|uniref:DUF2567 domain-containing protein n=1 Tax=Streptomyces gobiensis TaxID=2875706 RepID=UPI001E30F22B|nr:DUF2567 domain-containing protein [Streptomyces gobiensis]UGY90855.1 DUF2567 domain-containing protein [Streptomyces gobiensis]